MIFDQSNLGQRLGLVLREKHVQTDIGIKYKGSSKSFTTKVHKVEEQGVRKHVNTSGES